MLAHLRIPWSNSWWQGMPRQHLGPAHPTGCVPGARGAFIPVGLGVPSHPCRLAGSAGVRPGALDVRQSQPSQRLNSRRRRVLTYDAHVWRPQRRRFAAARGRRRGRRSGGWPRKGAAEAERAVTEIAADAKHRWLSQETAAARSAPQRLGRRWGIAHWRHIRAVGPISGVRKCPVMGPNTGGREWCCFPVPCSRCYKLIAKCCGEEIRDP